MMVRGHMPTQSALADMGLSDEYGDVLSAALSGDIPRFEKHMVQHSALYVQRGIFLLLGMLKPLVVRNFARRVIESTAYATDPTTRIDLSTLENAWSKETGAPPHEVHMSLTTLVARKAIRGYLSFEQQKMVLSKANAFPKMAQWDTH